MKELTPKNIIKCFEKVTDPRNPSGRRHPLPNMLALLAIGYLCDMNDIKEIVETCKKNDELKNILNFTKHGLPSRSTYSRILRKIDTTELNNALSEFTNEYHSGVQISIDGKTLRGSKNGEERARQVVNAINIGSKSIVSTEEITDGNEIESVRKTLSNIDIKDKIVTADALSTHKDIALLILERGGNFVFRVKDNNKKLKKSIFEAFASFSPSRQ